MSGTDGDGFDDLLHDAQRLTARLERGGVESLPRIERNLNQLKDAADKLAYKGPYSGATTDSTLVKASLLLGSRGFDVQKACQKLESLATSKTFEPLEPIRDTDIQGFLKNERENTLLAAVENSRTSTSRDVDDRYWESLECEWEGIKQELLTSLIDSGSSSMQLDLPTRDNRTMTTETSLLHHRIGLDNTELAYAKQIRVFNAKRLEENIKPNLCDLFIETATQLDNQNVIELWTLMKCMTDVGVSQMSSDVMAVRKSDRFQMSLIQQALLYLEKSYLRYMEKIVHSNLAKAQLGSMPGTLNYIRGFLNVKSNSPNIDMYEGGMYNGHPIWMMLFYCLRCGDVKSLMEVVNQSRQVLGDVEKFLAEYASSDNRRLSSGNEAELRLLYRRSIHSSPDPYKRAVCCVIGSCDMMDDHTEVALSVDDYLWIKLKQISEVGGDEPPSPALSHPTPSSSSKKPERLTLAQFQRMLLEEYGESHFNAHVQPLLYFRVLILTGQFESALEFLSRVDQSLLMYAVHSALVLYDASILLTPANINSLLLTKDEGVGRLNFVRLITSYTRKFESTDPSIALDYFYLLRDIKVSGGGMEGLEGRSLFNASVTELALETREFELLFGRLQMDGTRIPGAVDKYKVEMGKLISHVAQSAENKGRLDEALHLYDLCWNVEKVVELLNRMLSEVLTSPSAEKSQRNRLKENACNVANRYKTMKIVASRGAMETFYLLLDLFNFFDFYHNGQHEDAYNLMLALKLLPMSSDAVAEKVELFKRYTDEIRRNLPDILLSTMTILLSVYRKAKGLMNDSVGRSPLIGARTLSTSINQSAINKSNIDAGNIRSQAQALIMFAGMLPYRMPGDTNSRLVHMEVQMN